MVSNYIDFTGAATTYYEESAKFTSVTQPFNKEANEALMATLRRVQKLSAKAPLERVLWLSTGPQYETEAEVNAVDVLGGDIVGMTAPREAKLCAELGMLTSPLRERHPRTLRRADAALGAFSTRPSPRAHDRRTRRAVPAGVPYSVLAIASNWAAGRHPAGRDVALSHEEVSEMSSTTVGTVIACLTDLLKFGLGNATSKPAAAAPNGKGKRKR